jgi:MoaA/NifB/PqqE/SkfB family radical SAM enzyme
LVLRNVAELVRARDRLGVTWPVIEWQFLVLRHNVAEIDEARSRAADLGVDVFRYGGARGRMATKLRISTPANFAESATLLVSPDHELSEYDADGEKRRTAERDGCRWLWGKAVLNPDGGVAPCVSSWLAADDLGSWSGVHDSLGATWRSPAFQQARALARTGGDPSGTTVCAQCAHHRNFVPTPDNDRESVTAAHGLAELATRLRENGRPVSPAVLATVTDELISTR